MNTRFLLLSLQIRDAAKDLPEPGWVFIYPILIGLSYVVGVLVQGYIIVRRDQSQPINRERLCQMTAFGCALATVFIPIKSAFTAHALCLTAYGLLLGAFQFCLKMMVYDLTQVKAMERAWSAVKLAQSLPTILGPPCAGMCVCVFGCDPCCLE